MKRVTLFEHREVALAEAGLTEDEAWALVEASDGPKGATSGRTKALSVARRGKLRAASIVGIVTTGGVQAEILPKIERDADMAFPAEVDAAAARIDLVRMLQSAGALPLIDGRGAADWSGSSLLDIFATLYLDALVEVARRGLLRAYVGYEEDRPALRGRLDVVRQFSTLAARPQKLACRFDEFSLDTTLNRVLRAAIDLLGREGFSNDVRARARICASWFEEVTPLTPPRALLEKPRIDRTNRRFEEVLRLAMLFLRGARQTTRGGANDGFTLLFDMNALFEVYVTAELRRIYGQQGWTVLAQSGGLKLLAHEDGIGGAFATFPDIRMMRGSETWIVDAKWKWLQPDTNVETWGVGQGDVYQMAAYARLYSASKVLLLYPHWSGIPGEPGEHLRFTFEPEKKSQLIVATIALPEATTYPSSRYLSATG